MLCKYYFSEYSININECLIIFIIKGSQRYHVELEQLLAEFLHVESSIAFGMVCYFFIKKKR